MASTPKDLYAWMDENRDGLAAGLAKEREEIAMVEKMRRSLYDKRRRYICEKGNMRLPH